MLRSNSKQDLEESIERSIQEQDMSSLNFHRTGPMTQRNQTGGLIALFKEQSIINDRALTGATNNRRLHTQNRKVRMQLQIPIDSQARLGTAAAGTRRSYATRWLKPHVPPDKLESKQSMKTLHCDANSNTDEWQDMNSGMQGRFHSPDKRPTSVDKDRTERKAS